MAPCAGGRERRRARARLRRQRRGRDAPTPQPVELPPALDAPEEVHDAGPDDRRRRRAAARRARGRAAQGVPGRSSTGRGLVLVMVRGDHRVNEIKLRNALGRRLPARRSEDEFAEPHRPAGYIGPVGADVPILLDDGASARAATSPARNRPDAHLRGVEPGRDFAFERVDVRTRRGGRHRRTGTRSGSSPRSRSATSSSSARATPSRSAPATSTSRRHVAADL